MPKIAYITKDFREETLDRINTAIGIIEEYQAQGFDLTLRQLYYQMVARGYIENSSNSYSNFGNNIDDARMSGLIDWDSIVDRTRNLQSNPHWRNPESIMHSVLDNYQIDKWRNQKKRVEVWVEKEALIGVLASVCNGLDVSYFACRGYTSQSEMWAAGQRFLGYVKFGIEPVILYLGDHDPSGIDMTRDVAERMKLFTGREIEVKRLALNYDQVLDYNPPPNPAKLTDSRIKSYTRKYGDESWELDALDPATIVNLIESAVLEYRDEDKWNESVEREKTDLAQLESIATNFNEVINYLSGG